MKHKLDSVFVWFYYMHLKYLSRANDSYPLFEARFSLGLSLGLLFHNTAVIVGAFFCYVHNKWISAAAIILCLYLVDKHYRLNSYEKRLTKNIDKSFESHKFNKKFGLIFFIFTIAYIFFAIFFGKYIYDHCFERLLILN